MSNTNESKTNETKPHLFTHDGDKVLILRRTGKDRISKNGFKYPDKAGTTVEAPDWNPNQVCGGGFHGWPWGLGLGDGAEYSLDDLWYILSAEPADVIGELEGGWKCKVRKAEVRFVGGFAEAMALLRDGFHACITAMAVNGFPDAVLENAGDYARLASSGDYAQLASSGDYARLASLGDYARLASSGDYAQLASSGSSAQLASSGYSARLASLGDYARLASSGDYARLASSGDYAQLASSGSSAQLASSGYSARLASLGDYARLASSGDYAQLDAIGKDSVVSISASGGCVRVGERGAFAIAYYTGDDGWNFITGKVGVDGVKADTWYCVRNGKLEEAK